MKYVFLLGRVLFSVVFIVKAVEHFSIGLMGEASSMGVPMVNVIVPIWGILAFFGGLSILLGYHAKVGGWLIVIFLIPVTFYMHPFWMADTTVIKGMQSYCFWKNLSLIGAALMIASFGAGPLSLSHSCCKKK